MRSYLPWITYWFYVTGLFLYLLKISENLWFSDIFRSYRKIPVIWNGLISKFNGNDLSSPALKQVQIRQQRTKVGSVFSLWKEIVSVVSKSYDHFFVVAYIYVICFLLLKVTSLWTILLIRLVMSVTAMLKWHWNWKLMPETYFRIFFFFFLEWNESDSR